MIADVVMETAIWPFQSNVLEINFKGEKHHDRNNKHPSF
jgi:hypothetical protein